MAPATVGVPTGTIAAEAAEIKVLADGTVVVLGPRTGTIVQSVASSGGGGGSAGKRPAAEESAKAPEEQKVTPKEEKPPEGTHEIRTPNRWGPDIEQQQGVGKQVGNFGHTNYERLRSFVPDNPDIVSDELAPGLEPEHRIANPSYNARNAPRIDRLDTTNKTVIEIKPKGLYDQGLAEAKAYAQEMDKYEGLGPGQHWKARCVTYDFDALLEYMRKIGYLSEEEVAKFLAKAAKGK